MTLSIGTGPLAGSPGGEFNFTLDGDPNPESHWLKGYAAPYWNKLDAWFVEEEPVFGRLRDPYHRVDVHESSRPVTVRANGQVIARSERPKLLFETGLATRVYVPRAD